MLFPAASASTILRISAAEAAAVKLSSSIRPMKCLVGRVGIPDSADGDGQRLVAIDERTLPALLGHLHPVDVQPFERSVERGRHVGPAVRRNPGRPFQKVVDDPPERVGADRRSPNRMCSTRGDRNTARAGRAARLNIVLRSGPSDVGKIHPSTVMAGGWSSGASGDRTYCVPFKANTLPTFPSAVCAGVGHGATEETAVVPADRV